MRRRGSILYGSPDEIQKWPYVWRVKLRSGLIIHQFDLSDPRRQHKWPKASCWEVENVAWLSRIPGWSERGVEIPERHRAIQVSRVFKIAGTGISARIYLLGHEAPNDVNRTLFSSAPNLRDGAGVQHIMYIQPRVVLSNDGRQLIFPGEIEASRDPHHKTLFEHWLDQPRPIDQLRRDVMRMEALRG